jgi:hypothetical protein
LSERECSSRQKLLYHCGQVITVLLSLAGGSRLPAELRQSPQSKTDRQFNIGTGGIATIILIIALIAYVLFSIWVTGRG